MAWKLLGKIEELLRLYIQFLPSTWGRIIKYGTSTFNQFYRVNLRKVPICQYIKVDPYTYMQKLLSKISSWHQKYESYIGLKKVKIIFLNQYHHKAKQNPLLIIHAIHFVFILFLYTFSDQLLCCILGSRQFWFCKVPIFKQKE